MKRIVVRLGGFCLALGISGSALAALSLVPVAQTNLVVDPGGAALVSPPARRVNDNLVNPWGIVTTPPGFPFFGWVFVANNGTSTWSVLQTDGDPVFTIDVDGAGGPGTAAPTGLVRNLTNAFKIGEGGFQFLSSFLSSSEDGTVAAWTPLLPGRAVVVLDNSAAGAIYKGLAILPARREERLYLTNFHEAGQVEIYDGGFGLVGTFSGHGLPAPPQGDVFAPFNVVVIDGTLYVSFAAKNLDDTDELHCTGCGRLQQFDRNGNFIRDLPVGDTLDAPWAMIPAPGDFGPFAHQLLVGNFGNGRVSAYRFGDGTFLGRLSGPQTPSSPPSCGAGGGLDHQFCVQGLWGLAPGETLGTLGKIFFAAGINDEADGLMGTIQPD